MALRGYRAAQRIINLTFKIKGIREQMTEVQQIISKINQALTMLRMLRWAYKLATTTLGPLGWALLGLEASAELYTQTTLGDFTPKEEYDSRSAS